MATSKPEFQGFVLQNGSSYCGLYKRKVMNVSNTVSTQYYWLPTNKSGDITDYRVNILNGTFADASTANSNYPLGYALYADNWPDEKYISYMYNFPMDSAGLQAFKESVDAMVSLGANNLVIPVFWHDVFTTYAEQTANSSSSWTNQDIYVNYAKDKGVKVSLMPHLYLSANYIPSFWGTSHNEKDIYGNDCAVGGYGNGHASLAGSGANMMKDFFQKVVARYNTILGAQFNWVSPVITEQSEYGFNYDNTVSGLTGKVIYGYSNDSKEGFRTWLQSTDNPDKYANIAALKTAWGSVANGYSSFSDVQPPTTPYGFNSSPADMEYKLSEIFMTNQGKDFWKYLAYGQLAKFASDCKTITETYSNAKFVVSFGGVAPNDPLCGIRATYDVIRWAEVSHGLKTGFGVDNRNNTMALSMDYCQNYTGKLLCELHHIDYGGGGDSPLSVEVVEANMRASGEAAIKNGIKDMLFIGMQKHGLYFDMMKRLLTYLKPVMNQNNDNSRQTVAPSVSVTLGELLSSPGGKAGLNKWLEAGGTNTVRKEYVFDNSVSPSTTDFPYTLSLFDCQTYYIRDAATKNSYYGRVTLNSSGVPEYTTLQQSYNTNRVPFLLSAFGITYVSGTKTRSTIEIIDNNGVVWVKCVQSTGVTSTEQGGKYNNNHPEFRYLPYITEDCRFWLPLPGAGGYYDVKITVYDAACRFDVYHADISAPGGIAYNEGKATTSAGSTETIRVSLSQMGQSNIDQRVIKINNNKWA